MAYPPPPPPSAVDSRPSAFAPSHALPRSPFPGQHLSGPSAQPGPALPPITQHQPAAQQSHTLPPFRQASQYPDGRGTQEYRHYPPLGRSDHGASTPVNRAYPHDPSHQQGTPTTPAQPGPYPAASSPEGTQPLIQPHHMDHGSHQVYPPVNGVPHGLPPPPQTQAHVPPQPAPPQSIHHEQHPQYLTTSMENHGSYGQSLQPMYHSTYTPASAVFNVQKRKNMRATQACEQCRQRKQKCDEGSPCSFCKEQGLNCQYRDTPPAKTDKNMEKLLNHMEAQTAALERLATKVDTFDARLRSLERTNEQTAADAQCMPSVPEEPAAAKSDMEDHRTAPHKLLLLWRSVRILLSAADVDLNDGYVMEAEDRGVLRLYTRGEGIDEYDGTQPGGRGSPAQGDEGSDISTSTPPEGVWGYGFPTTPNSQPRNSAAHSWGGLKPDGSLDLDVNTMDQLFESYMKNFHIMHPFLDRSRLRRLFNEFIKRYSWPSKQSEKGFALSEADDEEPPYKKQRFNGSAASYSSDMGAFRVPTERSSGNAIVFLVLALGKICSHSAPLPAPVPDNKLNANSAVTRQLSGNPGLIGSSPITGSIKPPPISPSSTPGAQSTLPHVEAIHMQNRRASDASSISSAKNIELIPGLAYYAKAAEILGDQADGNDLVHAQMFLLAGLYKGQLARVKESMSWFQMAGRALLSLLDRNKLYNEHYWTAYGGDIQKKMEKAQSKILDKRHNLIVLASWTCVQLESDILAELPLPSSGIQLKENMLLMPLNMTEDNAYNFQRGTRSDDWQHILLYYVAQMYLRRRLNQVHRELYGRGSLNQSIEQVKEMLRSHEDILGKWRENLPRHMHWNDSDPPATDILAARLRAKYWGARYVVNRPFLDFALHILPHVKEGANVRDAARDAHDNPRDEAEIQLFEAIKGMGESALWQACRRCIEAAMQSTVALDGVPERLIVTNIHGTAHAQFGNMLVCAATIYNNWLNTLVSRDRFQSLLERTIRFLRRLAPISPTCRMDCQILEKIHARLFGVTADVKPVYFNEGVESLSASGSFSAMT